MGYHIYALASSNNATPLHLLRETEARPGGRGCAEQSLWASAPPRQPANPPAPWCLFVGLLACLLACLLVMAPGIYSNKVL